MTDWFKISSALVELIDNLNEYSTPEESVSALDNVNLLNFKRQKENYSN